MKYLLCLFSTVLLCAIVLGRPQNQENFDSFPTPEQWQQQARQVQQRPFRPGQNPGFPTTSRRPGVDPANTTTPPATAPTTASPQYLACLGACPTTMEYNPVCGNDEQNYHNMWRLQCAQRCGRDVAVVRAGTCSAL